MLLWNIHKALAKLGRFEECEYRCSRKRCLVLNSYVAGIYGDY